MRRYTPMLCHDPRLSDDPSHKVETSNPALIAAELVRQGWPWSPPDWTLVAGDADYMEEHPSATYAELRAARPRK